MTILIFTKGNGPVSQCLIECVSKINSNLIRHCEAGPIYIKITPFCIYIYTDNLL